MLSLLSAGILGLALAGRTAALVGYIALPLLGLPTAALGHAAAALALRCLGQGLTRLAVRGLQYAAPAAPLLASTAGFRLEGWFGWWAASGPAAAVGTAASLALGPLLVGLAALATPARAGAAPGEGGPGGSALNPNGFRALVRKELRLITRDPRSWGRLLGGPIATGAVFLGIVYLNPLLAEPLWASVILGVFGAGIVGLMSDVITRGEEERLSLLRLSPTPLNRLVTAKALLALPLVLPMAVGGGLVLVREGVAQAAVVMAAGVATGTFTIWFNVKDRLRTFTTPSSVWTYVTACLWFLVVLLACAGVLSYAQIGPMVGVINFLFACVPAAGALFILGRMRW